MQLISVYLLHSLSLAQKQHLPCFKTGIDLHVCLFFCRTSKATVGASKQENSYSVPIILAKLNVGV